MFDTAGCRPSFTNEVGPDDQPTEAKAKTDYSFCLVCSLAMRRRRVVKASSLADNVNVVCGLKMK